MAVGKAAAGGRGNTLTIRIKPIEGEVELIRRLIKKQGGKPVRKP